MLQTKRNYYNDGGVNYGYSSTINHFKEMENSLKIWHAVVATLGLLITIVTLIVMLSTRIENQRLRIEFLESDAKDTRLQIKDFNQQQNQQYREINMKLTDIQVSLQNKENKK